MTDHSIRPESTHRRSPRWRPSRESLLIATAALIGLAHLWLTVGPGIVLPSHPFWRVMPDDMAQAVMGGEAFLRDRAWHFPIAATAKLLAGGKPTSVVYTDSAPWIAVLLKAMGFGVGDVSVVGLTLALAIILQPIAFVVLLLALGVKRTECVLVGALLAVLLPAWYIRASWHVALASHWVLLSALALAVVAIRRGVSWGVVVGFALLGAFSIGVHAYLFLMVAAIAAGGLLADVARLGMRALPRAATGLALLLASSATAAWALGYGPSGGSFGYGMFSMNLLSPLVPQKSGITQLLLGTPRWFMDATGGQYEGFNYFGIGILCCIAAAIALFRQLRPSNAALRTSIPLVAAMLALTMLALSNKVYASHLLLLDVPVPNRLMALLVQVRSSGRLFWPVAYAALAASIYILDRSPRRAAVGAGLAVALLLQVIDTSVMREMLRAAYRSTPPRAGFDTSAWAAGGVFAGQDLRVMPSYSCTGHEDHSTIRRAALAVERSGGVVDGGPTARFDPVLCDTAAYVRVLDDTARTGLDLLMTRSLPPALTKRAAASPACLPIDHGFLCGRGVVAAAASGRFIATPARAPR